jgi:predicted Zn-dependent peptidase
MSKIHLTQLENGLRIVTDEVPDVHSAALGIWVSVGTRDENIADNGVAHMVEHMLFKGTKTRSALEIAEVIENVGGQLNAYTSREVTSYHAHILKDDMVLGLDTLADMYQNYTLPEDEIERERGVIVQEIGMCNDTPDDLVFDNYYETAYPGQSLGAPILGRESNISGMSKKTLQEYITRHYTPANTVISAAGSVRHEDFVNRVQNTFGQFKAVKPEKRASAKYKGGDHRTEKELEQCHFVLGFQGISRLDDNYYAALALSSVLGGGMSSRLFQEVREKRGLVYSIFSFHSSYIDDGQLGIYAGTGPGKLKDVVPIICDEVNKIADSITEEELARAKAQLRAGLLMGRESMMTRADQQAKYAIYRNEALVLKELTSLIDGITKDSVSALARRIFATPPTLAALGPLAQLESYDSITKRLAA